MRDIGLVPLADMPNHNNVPVSWRINETTRTFDLVTHRPYKKGEEVFISYGSLDNSHLLYVYGFALPGNEIKIPNPCKEGEEQAHNETLQDECVLAKMKQYRTSIRDDLQLLQQETLPFKKVNAIKLRIEERMALLGLNEATVD